MEYFDRKFKTLKGVAVSIVIGALAVGLVGCNDTAQGASKDAKENMDAVEKKTDEMGKDMKNAADDAGAKMEDLTQAGKLTPQIKTAITSNPSLNDDGNLVNVDTDSTHVWLKGHVKTEALKAEAEKLAAKILSENKATQTIKNELVVQP